MHFSIQWYSGPSIETIKGEILEGRLSSGKYPKQLLGKIVFVGPAADEGERAKKGSIFLTRGATPHEIARLYVDVSYRLLIDDGVLMANIITGFNGGRSPESMAINLATVVEDVIKLLKKAPRDARIAKVRQTLKSALEF